MFVIEGMLIQTAVTGSRWKESGGKLLNRALGESFSPSQPETSRPSAEPVASPCRTPPGSKRVTAGEREISGKCNVG